MAKLNILWTTSDKDTVSSMLSMYAGNALKNGWWDEINIVIWGGSSKLVGEDPKIQKLVVRYMGVPLTKYIKGDDKLITI